MSDFERPRRLGIQIWIRNHFEPERDRVDEPFRHRRRAETASDRCAQHGTARPDRRTRADARAHDGAERAAIHGEEVEPRAGVHARPAQSLFALTICGEFRL